MFSIIWYYSDNNSAETTFVYILSDLSDFESITQFKVLIW